MLADDDRLPGANATTVAVIAVAILGLTLLSGRIDVRQGGRVVLGIFILLGAPAIAAGLGASWAAIGEDGPQVVPVVAPAEMPRADLPPANYDPYAGASLRSD